MIKSLWTSIQGDPVFMRKLNGWLTMFWIAMIPVSLITHWISGDRRRRSVVMGARFGALVCVAGREGRGEPTARE